MIKKLLVALAIILPSFAFAQKIAVVDAESILNAMPEHKEAEEKMAAISKNYETELGNIDAELQKKYEAFQALPASTSQGIKDTRMQEIQTLGQRRDQFLQTAQQDMQRQSQQLMQPIQEKLINAIKAVGAEQGYSMIIPEGVAIYVGNDVTNVTDAVKTKLGIK